MSGRGGDSLELSLVSIEWDFGYVLFSLFYCANKWFCNTMPPRKDTTNENPSDSNSGSGGPLGDN